MTNRPYGYPKGTNRVERAARLAISMTHHIREHGCRHHGPAGWIDGKPCTRRDAVQSAFEVLWGNLS